MKILAICVVVLVFSCDRPAATTQHSNEHDQVNLQPQPATPPSEIRPLPVGGEVTAPVAVTRVEPKLPEHLARTGPLLLKATIDHTGVVRDVQIVNDGTTPQVGPLYVQAMKNWRFKPGTLRGQPVDTQYSMSVIIDVR